MKMPGLFTSIGRAFAPKQSRVSAGVPSYGMIPPLGSVPSGSVELLPGHFHREVLLRHPPGRIVVRIDVPLPVPEHLGSAIVRVAQMHRNRTGPAIMS